jgi:serine/threonine protein kinase
MERSLLRITQMGNELNLDALCQKDEGERMSLHPGTLVGGSYLIDRVLGIGGMGTVVAARSLVTGELVAIKFMLPHCAEHRHLLVRFQREARATERLKSEHVGRVLATGEVGPNAPFMVMEYLDGEDLRSLVKREGPLEPRQAAAYVSQACTGLAEAHALGIVHRDLKPANLFLARRPRGPSIIKVLDFGVAKFDSPNVAGDDQDVTTTHAMVGTHHYMAPEQIVSPHAVTAVADVWALGAILHFLLTGKTPFAAPTVAEVLVNVLREPPHPIEELRPCVPPRLAAIVRRCLEKDREKRYPNATELARELEPLARMHHEHEAPASAPVRRGLIRTERLLVPDSSELDRLAAAHRPSDAPELRGRRSGRAPTLLRTRAFMVGGALGSMFVGGLLAVAALSGRSGMLARAAPSPETGAAPTRSTTGAVGIEGTADEASATPSGVGAPSVGDVPAEGEKGGDEIEASVESVRGVTAKEASSAAVSAAPDQPSSSATPMPVAPGRATAKSKVGVGGGSGGWAREAPRQAPSASSRAGVELRPIFEFKE